MFRKAYPSDLTDTEWTFINPCCLLNQPLDILGKWTFEKLSMAFFMFSEKAVLGEDYLEISHPGKRSIIFTSLATARNLAEDS
jgi:hypothetical protein